MKQYAIRPLSFLSASGQINILREIITFSLAFIPYLAKGKFPLANVKALGSLKSYTKSSGTELNTKRIEEKKKLSGRFTIVKDTDLPVAEIEAHVLVRVLSLLISRLFKKSMNDEMTVSMISDMSSELKAILVRTSEGIITLRAGSKSGRNMLDKMKIPYPGKILSSIPA